MTSFDPLQKFWKSIDQYEDDDNGTSMLPNGTFCSDKWIDLWDIYNSHVHYPFLFFICILGGVTNVLNLFIFTRPVMRNPTNLLLSVLAVTDFLCVFRKSIDVSLRIYRRGHDPRTSYHSHVEDWINEICFHLFHTWAIYMTVVVALWRLLGILRPMQSRYWLSYKTATSISAISIGFATLLIPLLYVGSSLELCTSALQHDKREGKQKDPKYVMTQTEFGEGLQFWIQGLPMTLVPRFILIVSIILIKISLSAAAKKRLALFGDQNLKTVVASNKSSSNNLNWASNSNLHADGIEAVAKPTTPRTATSSAIIVETRIQRKRTASAATKDFIKTSKMLIVPPILFLVIELPPGILRFCFGLVNSKKRLLLECYDPMRPFLNLNECISSSMGFFIYFLMSSKFRQTFVQHFWIRNRTHPNYLSTLLSKVRLLHTKGEEESSSENKSPTTAGEVVLHDC